MVIGRGVSASFPGIAFPHLLEGNQALKNQWGKCVHLKLSNLTYQVRFVKKQGGRPTRLTKNNDA